MVETKPAGFGANPPVPLGLRPASASLSSLLARSMAIAELTEPGVWEAWHRVHVNIAVSAERPAWT